MTSGSALAPGAVAVGVGSELLIWIPDSDMTHLLDPLAAEVLHLLQAGEPDEVAVALASRYRSDVALVLADVRSLKDFFEDEGILVRGDR